MSHKVIRNGEICIATRYVQGVKHKNVRDNKIKTRDGVYLIEYGDYIIERPNGDIHYVKPNIYLEKFEVV